MSLLRDAKCRYCGHVLALRLMDDMFVCPYCGAVFMEYKGVRGRPMVEVSAPIAGVATAEMRVFAYEFPPEAREEYLKMGAKQAEYNLLKVLEPHIEHSQEKRIVEGQPCTVLTARLRLVGKDHVFR